MTLAPALHLYKDTKVPIHQSRGDIEQLLRRVGATGFRWSSFPGAETLEAYIKWQGRELSFKIAVKFKPGDDKRQKQLMRVMYFYIKTKVEAVQVGLVDLEHEFLPYLLTKSGKTVYELVDESKDEWLALPPGRTGSE